MPDMWVKCQVSQNKNIAFLRVQAIGSLLYTHLGSKHREEGCDDCAIDGGKQSDTTILQKKRI